LGREGDYSFRSSCEIEPLDFAILIVNDLLAARKKSVAGKNVTSEERFLIVARNRILHPAVLPAFEVAQTQAGLRLVTRDVENLLAIRRKHWTKCAFETKMYLPSGDQLGEVKSLLGSFDTCFTPVPSGCMIQMFSLPSRSEMKAIHWPSGENFGWLSNDMPPSIGLAWPPSIGSVSIA